MSIRIRGPRSYWELLLWALGAFVVLILLSNVYAKVRLYWAYDQALELAQQLGLKTDNLLREPHAAAHRLSHERGAHPRHRFGAGRGAAAADGKGEERRPCVLAAVNEGSRKRRHGRKTGPAFLYRLKL